MILDSSAIIAVMLAEPGHERLRDRLGDSIMVGVGAPTVVETAMVLSTRLGRDARPALQEFLREAEVEVIPFTPEHFNAAVDAFLRYGKGRHAAGLNFGDCLAYAVASVADLPLLYKGDDFAATDITPA